MTQTADASPSIADPFDAGPFAGLRVQHAVLPTSAWSVARRALIVAAVAWIPLAALAAAQGYALRDAPRESLLLDLSTYARYLVALPLLVLAEAVCLPRLALVARHFGEARLVADLDLPRYNELIAGALGRRFEERWLERAKAIDAEALGAPDFSATTDLFSVAKNVREMRMVPLDLTGVVSLVAATLVPFNPVLIMVLPLEQLLRYVGKLLL